MNDKKQCEAAVRFDRKGDEGVKRYVGDDEIEVGFSLGKFLYKLYKDGGRVLELVVCRPDGTFMQLTGDEWEARVGIKDGVLE